MPVVIDCGNTIFKHAIFLTLRLVGICNAKVNNKFKKSFSGTNGSDKLLVI